MDVALLSSLESICSSTFSAFPSLSLSLYFSFALHPSPSISSLSALPSHFHQWNYCQGTVIIEFPDSRSPAPPFILYTALPPHPTLTPFPLASSLSLLKSSINVLSNTLLQRSAEVSLSSEEEDVRPKRRKTQAGKERGRETRTRELNDKKPAKKLSSLFTATIIRVWPHYRLCWHEVID